MSPSVLKYVFKPEDLYPHQKGQRSFHLFLGTKQKLKSDKPIALITLKHGKGQPENIQKLVLNGSEIPSSHWKAKPDNSLLFTDPDTGLQSQLIFDNGMNRATGSMFLQSGTEALMAELPPITYQCSTAVHTGAYVTGTTPAIVLHWDDSSHDWENAKWQENNLNITYQLHENIIVGQKFYDFSLSFKDNQTGNTWTPAKNDFYFLIDQNMMLQIVLTGNQKPPVDNRSGQPGNIPTLYPYRVSIQLCQTAQHGMGAMLTEADAQNGTVVGLQAQYVSGSVSTSESVNDFALTQAMPAAGSSASLNLTDLASLTPFSNDNGWFDDVQKTSMGYFNNIMLFYMQPDLRKKYWSQSQPDLPPKLQKIAPMAPAGENPGEWYQSLSVAFLSNVMSQWKQEGSDTLNGIRAGNWLSQTTAASGVYNLQMNALYALAYQEKNPIIQDYAEDQKANASKYEPLIQDDLLKWKTEHLDRIVDPTTRQKTLEYMENLAEVAIKDNLYWAYTLFRYGTSQIEVNILQAMISGYVGDKTAYYRHVQSLSVTLSMLDPSNLFSQKYLSFVQSLMIGSILPTEADYGQHQDDYKRAVELVLKNVQKEYGGSADPTLSKIAVMAQDLLKRDDLTTLISTMQSAASRQVSGGWIDTADIMANSVSQQITQSSAQLLASSFASLAVGGTIAGVSDWDSFIYSLSSGGGGGISASTVITMAKYTTQVVALTIKWGVAFKYALGDVAISWASVSDLFSMSMLMEANRNLESGFAKWLIGKRVIDPTSELYSTIMAEGSGRNQSMVVRVFGRNLDEFFAVRLQAVFSFAALIVGVLSLMDAETTDEEIMGWLSVSASLMSFAAAAGEWSVQAFGLVESLSTFFSVLGCLGTVATVAGVVFMIYLFFKHIPSPIEQFAQTYAQPDGFFMPFTSAIDQFIGFSVNGQPSRLGISLQPSGENQFVKTSDKGQLSLSDQTYSFDAVFFANTSGEGVTTISAVIDGTSRLLTITSGGTIAFALPVSGDAANRDSQRWIVELLKDPAMDGSNPSSGVFSIQSKSSGTYLAFKNGQFLMKSDAFRWTVCQQPMIPAGISMQNFALKTYSQDAVTTASLDQPGSTPQNWSITPALPDFISLDQNSGILQVTSKAPQPLPVLKPEKHTLSVKNHVGADKPVSVDFVLSITAPA
ncbi:hypothetical protein ACH42_03360 [Endozoicomonas sp. (ex Bugula neritina AB1)]|nr:hypothetical protein ACH42_03360 [Endozoicomonas sp. (ex Bugula neritina AB1)]